MDRKEAFVRPKNAHKVLILAVVALCGFSAVGFKMIRRGRGYSGGPVGEIRQIAENLYVIPGGGGNSTMLVRKDGILLVDTKYPERFDDLMVQVRKVTNLPITHVINTHAHGDHSGGNAFLPPNTEIVMHENAARTIGNSQRNRARIRQFKDFITLFDGEEAVDVYWFGRAHTDGDAFVVFRHQGVVQMGDVFSNKMTPVINATLGGDSAEYIATLDHLLAAAPFVRQVVTGHGPVLTWQDLFEYRDFCEELIGQIQASLDAGHTQEQALREIHIPARFASQNLLNLQKTILSVYLSAELRAKQNTRVMTPTQ